MTPHPPILHGPGIEPGLKNLQISSDVYGSSPKTKALEKQWLVLSKFLLMY